jgi:DNA-binding response OmpR family regulator
MANVLVVSDDVWVDNDVRASLTDPGTVITACPIPAPRWPAAEEHSPDVAVVDLQVGSMGEWRWCGRCARPSSWTNCIPCD